MIPNSYQIGMVPFSGALAKRRVSHWKCWVKNTVGCSQSTRCSGWSRFLRELVRDRPEKLQPIDEVQRVVTAFATSAPGECGSLQPIDEVQRVVTSTVSPRAGASSAVAANRRGAAGGHRGLSRGPADAVGTLQPIDEVQRVVTPLGWEWGAGASGLQPIDEVQRVVTEPLPDLQRCGASLQPIDEVQRVVTAGARLGLGGGCGVAANRRGAAGGHVLECLLKAALLERLQPIDEVQRVVT